MGGLGQKYGGCPQDTPDFFMRILIRMNIKKLSRFIVKFLFVFNKKTIKFSAHNFFWETLIVVTIL